MSSIPLVSTNQTYGNLPYHYYSDYYAPSALVTTVINALCLGIVLYDSCANVLFDVRLIRSPGWKRPIRAINRLAYFAIRLLAIVYLVLMTSYVNIKFDGDCNHYFRAIFLVWYIAIVLIDIIFFTRTLALYEWHRLLTVTLVCLFCAQNGIGLNGILHWGQASRLGQTQFCYYQSEKPGPGFEERQFLAFFCMTTMFDIIILVLTCNRLAAEEDHAARQSSKLSRTLYVQGFVLYGCLLSLKVGFIMFHYLADHRQFWNLFGMAIGLTTAYITASTLIRQTSLVVQEQSVTSSFHSSRNGGGGDTLSSRRPISIVIDKPIADVNADGENVGFVFAPTLPK